MNKLDNEINILTDEYRKALKEAYLYACEDFQPEDIQTLRRLDREAKRTLFKFTRNRVRQRRIALIYSAMILTISYITAVTCFLYKFPNIDTILPIVLSATIASISLIYLSLFFPPFKYKKPNSIIIKHELISTWNELESITRELTNVKEIDRYVSPKFYLTQMGILSEDEQNNIMHLLALRNKVVHFTDEHISDQEIIQVTDSAKKIIKKLTAQTLK